MENWQIGRYSGELKLSDIRTENLVQLLRQVIAHHDWLCPHRVEQGFCPLTKGAEDFLFIYDDYLGEANGT